MTHVKGFQIGTLLSLDHRWPTSRGHGCTGHHMFLIHERDAWAWMHSSPYDLDTRTGSWFGHGCAGHHMLLIHERCYDLGMDALVTVCS